ncbi:MAG: cytochrome c biogenesis protein CcsA [Phycisphaerales bacterium]
MNTPTSLPMRLLQPLASLRLTVVLFALAIFLILAGTLAQTNEGIWTVVDRYFRSIYVAIPLHIFLPRRFEEIPVVIPFPGGLTLGVVIFFNLIAAHAVRFKLKWNRSGMIITHAGVLLLLIGEFVTGIAAREGNMTIDEGGSSQYTEDIRTSELAIIDESDPNTDRVVVIPQRFMANGGEVSNPLLPFRVRVHQWMPNSNLLGPMQATKEQLARATAGMGTKIAAVQVPQATGVDGATIDVPAAYVEFIGENSLGTYLVSPSISEQDSGFFQPQIISYKGKDYRVDLRFARHYKPYQLHLIDFKHDKFVGTEKPRNFSSHLRLVDPERNVDREVLISMNNPLRYRGETFYQSSFKSDNKTTILQVVRNPGWLIPYISCVVVTLGMLIHFGIRLASGVRRTGAKPASAQGVANSASLDERVALTKPRGLLQFALPALFAIISIALIAAVVTRSNRHSAASAMPLEEIGRLPVSAGGRTQPLDSFARNTLMSLSNRQTYDVTTTVDGKETTRKGEAIEWLMEAWTNRKDAAERRVFRIDHPEVKSLLGITDETRTRFSFSEIQPKLMDVEDQAQRARQTLARDRDIFQRSVLGLYSKLVEYSDTAVFDAPYVIPPLAAGEEWRPLPTALDPNSTGSREGAEAFAIILQNYQKGDIAATQDAVRKYEQIISQPLSTEIRAADSEVLFNRSEPFYNASILYVLAFLLASFGLLLKSLSPIKWAPALARAAFSVLIIAFVVHTLGLIARIYLQGRPPVTNLYSSAVFVGWACIPLALFGERFHRTGIFHLAASLIGFTTLVIAHNLATTSGGDTMEMMQAVLDSNFWLATHVVVITIGYSATFLAGFLACIYILAGVFTKLLAGEPMKALPKMIYGVTCFASITSFVGTVLGGIWADQSWGRFWGWDPKENGACLIVLWTLLILHARWGGLIKDRGVAVLAVFGNIVTSWSWFGTNMLGVGLHSYGFMDKAVYGMIVFAVIQLTIMSVAFIPQNSWRSVKA